MHQRLIDCNIDSLNRFSPYGLHLSMEFFAMSWCISHKLKFNTKDKENWFKGKMFMKFTGTSALQDNHVCSNVFLRVCECNVYSSRSSIYNTYTYVYSRTYYKLCTYIYAKNYTHSLTLSPPHSLNDSPKQQQYERSWNLAE